MKLKNLLFATMVACAFTACSNENDPIDNVTPPAPEAAEATISFKASATNLQSKATDAGTDDERTISKLTVLVFQNADGNAYLTSKTVENPVNVEGVYFIEDVKVKATNVSVLLVANVTDPSIFTGKNLAACEDLTVNRATASTANNFVMSTAKFDGELTPGKTNCFGYTVAQSDKEVTSNGNVITLYRVAARVQLDKVTVKFDQTTDLKGAKLEITNVFMSNVRGASKYMSGTLGSLEVTNGWMCGINPETTGTGDLLGTGDVELDNTLNKSYETSISIVSGNDAVSESITGARFYILENEHTTVDRVGNNAYTLLVIQTTLYKKIDDAFDGGTVRYYTVKVNEVGSTGDGAGTGKILHNNIYKIEDATLTGTGSNNPYIPEASSSISAKVVVAPWNVVSQAPEIE